MKKIPIALLLSLVLLSLPVRANLVGLYTFDGANPLEAVIGSPANEGVTSGNNQQPVLSDAISTISLVSDGTVLVDGYGFMDDEITLPRDSVALWCSISPTMALKISEYGYAQRNGYDFGGNNKENIRIFRMVNWLKSTFGIE